MIRHSFTKESKELSEIDRVYLEKKQYELNNFRKQFTAAAQEYKLSDTVSRYYLNLAENELEKLKHFIDHDKTKKLRELDSLVPTQYDFSSLKVFGLDGKTVDGIIPSSWLTSCITM